MLPRIGGPFRQLVTLPSGSRQISIASHLAAASASSSSDNTITINGWIRSCRRQKNVAFAVINDGSNVHGVQAVLLKGLDAGLTVGTSVMMRGQLVDSPGKGQAKEFKAEGVEVLGESNAEASLRSSASSKHSDYNKQAYPIPNTKQGVPAPILRRNAHLRARAPAAAAMLRLRSEMAWAVSDHFRKQGFHNVQTPLITSSDCEGAGEVFRVESGEAAPPTPTTSTSPPKPPSTPRFLTVSSQLHLEAIASSLSNVYTLSPSFRAEESDTSRHLQEFWMLEAEQSFLPIGEAEGLAKVMDTTEGVVKAVAQVFHASASARYFYAQTDGLETQVAQLAAGDSAAPFARLSYNAAIDLLKAHAERNPKRFAFPPQWEKGLQTEHEKWLAEEHVGGPVFVTDYPAPLKPWYMLPNTADGGATVACFDLLVPRLGELVGGSLREHREKELLRAMEARRIKKEDYEWYLDLRRYGTTRHGGFGMGWERLVAFLTGLDNVRDCIAFPRAAEGSRF